MYIQKNLEYLMSSGGYNPTSLAKATGVPQPTILRIVTGESTDPRSSTLAPLAKFFGFTVTDLRDRDLSVESFEASAPNTRGETSTWRVPLVSWVKAGDFDENNDVLADDGRFVKTTYRARERTFALIVDGPSMEPLFPNGCTIIVEPDEQAKNGSYIVVRQNGDQEATFKQLVIDGGKMYLKALNPDWPRRIIEMLPDAVICGVVKKFEMEV